MSDSYDGGSGDTRVGQDLDQKQPVDAGPYDLKRSSLEPDPGSLSASPQGSRLAQTVGRRLVAGGMADTARLKSLAREESVQVAGI
jgi:hypothetical protein